jgi:hypothetical protein
MKLEQRAAALEAMTRTAGWKILEAHLEKKSHPELLAVTNFDTLIRQAYINGVCQGHKDVQDFVKVTIENARRRTQNSI